MDDQHLRGQLEAVSKAFAVALAAAAGNEAKERDACEAAVADYMRIRRAAGADPKASPSDLMCAEFFAEGDDASASAFARVRHAKDDDVGRWWEKLADAAGY